MELRQSIFGMVCLAAAFSATVVAAETLSNTLSAYRIVAQSDGSELRETAAAAKPGDVIEYDVDLHNSGSSAVRALEPTLPIPVGVALVPSTVHPAGARASLDGRTFAPMPLMRRVVRADGSVAEEPVPAAEYRALRWSPAELAANGSLSVSARVVLIDNSAVTPAK
jgi:uncharacterized repeat protein (TIGR01451 family)